MRLSFDGTGERLSYVIKEGRRTKKSPEEPRGLKEIRIWFSHYVGRGE